MNTVDVFWVIIDSLAFILFLLALREALLLYRLPPLHPDRGFYWFNMFFLLIASFAVVWGGNYVDLGRRTLENMIPTPPSSRYAIERNSIIHDTNWIYTSKQTDEEIRSFYRAFAKRQHIPLIEDDHDGLRMSFALPSGDLFLTLSHEDDKTILYFSRGGQIRTVSTPAESR